MSTLNLGTGLPAGGFGCHVQAKKREPGRRIDRRAPAAARRPVRSAAPLDAWLDLGLLQTFPGSDPIAIGGDTGTQPSSRPVDRFPGAIADAVEAARTRRKRVAGRACWGGREPGYVRFSDVQVLRKRGALLDEA